MRTLGSLFFALQVEGEGGAVPGSSGSQILALLANTSYVSRVVLLILALFSIASWAVILYKWWTFRQAERHSAQFLDVFRRSNKFSEVQAVCKSLEDSPLVGTVSIRIRGAHGAAAQHERGRRHRQSTFDRRSSYSQESDRRRSFADARVGR